MSAQARHPGRRVAESRDRMTRRAPESEDGPRLLLRRAGMTMEFGTVVRGALRDD
jgi:hypothetical protein